MTTKHTPALTAEIIESQGEYFTQAAEQIRQGNYRDAMMTIICAQSVIAQELANIADNWED